MHFQLYGLRLDSARSIPGLVASDESVAADIRLRLQAAPPAFEGKSRRRQVRHLSGSVTGTGEPALTIWTFDRNSGFGFRYGDGAEFFVDRAGTEVWAAWPESLTVEDVATYLLGPVMGFVLRLRGRTCLHAAAIAVGDRAVALAGPPGAGKSTTAAAFARLGYPVLSDDLLPVTEEHGIVSVASGYPRLRLWPESVRALFGSGDALPRLTPTWEKRALDLTSAGHDFHSGQLPLAAIYILGQRRAHDAPLVAAASGHAGLMALVANTYASSRPDAPARARDLVLLGRAAAKVPVKRVTPHTDFEGLPALCGAILDDFHARV